MIRSTLYRITVVLMLLLFSVNPGSMTVAAPDSPPQVESMSGLDRPVAVRLDPSTSTFRIPPPAIYTQRSLLKVQTATINVTYLPNGATDAFGLSCLTWPAAAITAFEYAAGIWETLLTSTVPIEINACWTNFGDPNILGISGIDGYYRDFPSAPEAGTWYPTALANALQGSRMSGSTVDMHVAYGSTFSWYYGTDGNPGFNEVDFASVVLHEICHGLGFAGSMDWDDGVYNPSQGNYQECNGVAGQGCWGAGTIYPDSYDRFAEDGSSNALINTAVYPNPSTSLGNALTGNAVWFDGSHATAANGGGRVKLYAPSSWEPGSSYSHLDEIFNNTTDDLMTYAIPNGQSMHAPGPVILGMLTDIGWSFPADNTAPVLSGVPDLALNPGEARDDAIDLWAYATDDIDPDADLTFTIANSPPAGAGVSIDGDRYIDINPTAGYVGDVPVTIEVEDTGGLTDTDTFTITFATIVNTAPVLSGLPDQALNPGEAKNGAIDLWAYATDDLDADDVMTYTITNSPPVSVGVTINAYRYIDIAPTGSFTGTFPVVVEVTDTGGLTDTDSFTITFTELDTQYIYLPLVMRCYPVVPYLSAISNADGDGLYTVQWAMPACCSQTPSQYEFQVATTPQFSSVDGDTTTATSVDVYTPDPATYYWRVRAYIDGQWTRWSNVRSVNVRAFSYVFVYNLTGGTMMVEIVNVQKSTFSTGFEGYWRSVPVGNYFVRVWARCGYWQDTNMYFPLGESHELAFECSQASLVSSVFPTPEMPGVDFVFRSTASEMTAP